MREESACRNPHADVAWATPSQRHHPTAKISSQSLSQIMQLTTRTRDALMTALIARGALAVVGAYSVGRARPVYELARYSTSCLLYGRVAGGRSCPLPLAAARSRPHRAALDADAAAAAAAASCEPRRAGHPCRPAS